MKYKCWTLVFLPTTYQHLSCGMKYRYLSSLHLPLHPIRAQEKWICVILQYQACGSSDRQFDWLDARTSGFCYSVNFYEPSNHWNNIIPICICPLHGYAKHTSPCFFNGPSDVEIGIEVLWKDVLGMLIPREQLWSTWGGLSAFAGWNSSWKRLRGFRR